MPKHDDPVSGAGYCRDAALWIHSAEIQNPRNFRDMEPQSASTRQTNPALQPAPQNPFNRKRFERWMGTVAAIVLSMATVLTAWCGYQAARWGGVQASSYSQAGASRTQAAQKNNEATLRMNMHLTLFTQYVVATAQENTKLADFIYARFPPTLRIATDEWLKTQPLTNPDAPRSPFDMPIYQLPEQIESERLEKLADEKAQKAADANEFSDHYVLLTVIFASSLFFCGISSKFRWLSFEAGMIGIGTLLLLGGFVVALTLPII